MGCGGEDVMSCERGLDEEEVDHGERGHGEKGGDVGVEEHVCGLLLEHPHGVGQDHRVNRGGTGS